MEKISNKQYHNIQLKSVRLVSINSFVSSDFNDTDDKENINVETSVGNFGEVISEIKGKTFLKTKVKGTIEEKTIFEIETIYEGVCESIKKIDEKEFEFFLNVQSIPMLWSYSRETINNIMLKMNLRPILLPVLNITDIINKTINSREDVDGEE